MSGGEERRPAPEGDEDGARERDGAADGRSGRGAGAEDPGGSGDTAAVSRRELPMAERVSEGGKAHAAAEAEAHLAEIGQRDARPDPEPVDLDEDEQELIELELEALGPVPDERRQAYDELARTAGMGRVPTHLVPLLERLVAVSLESGRARRRYLAEGEKVLTGLFERLPAGKELRSSIDGVNRALDVLDGRTVTGVKVGLRTLGHFRIALETEDVKVTLSVRSSSVALESLAVTGGG